MSGKPKSTDSSPFNKDRFASFLKALRRSMDISQEELAESAGLSKQVISNLESGRAAPAIDTLCQLADALGASATDMLSAGLRERASSHPTQIDRAIQLLSSFSASDIREAVAILEAVGRVRSRKGSLG